MSKLDYFREFVSKNSEEIKTGFFVWIYARVSSKEQFERNSSADRQIEANRDYARHFNYRVTEEFSGTYESAKSDFIRKELNAYLIKYRAAERNLMQFSFIK